MRWLILVFALMVGAAQSQEKVASQKDTNSGTKKSSQQKPGTEQSPVVIKIQPTPEDKQEAEAREKERKNKEKSEADLVWWTRALGVLAGLQLLALLLHAGIFGYQAKKLKQTVDTATSQSVEMQRSIAEAARAATAMENVANATANNATMVRDIFHKQIRAYLAVDIGVPTCQEGQLRFAASPVMTNTGFTPARRVSHRISAAILNTNLPDDFRFEAPPHWNINDAVLSPRQTFVLNSVVRDRYAPEDIEEIMRGEHRRLFVWGTITYEDIFGNGWETNFCHNFFFFKARDTDGAERIRFNGFFYRSHNNAT